MRVISDFKIERVRISKEKNSFSKNCKAVKRSYSCEEEKVWDKNRFLR